MRKEEGGLSAVDRATHQMARSFTEGSNETSPVPALSRGLFLIGFIAWIVWRVVASSFLTLPDGSIVHTAIHGITLLLLLFSAVCGKKSPTSAAVALIQLGIGVAVYALSGDSILVDLSIILYACSMFSVRWAIKVGAIALAVSVLVVVGSSQIGLIQDHLFLRADGSVRHGLGFLYCTYLSHYYFNLVLAYLYLRGRAPRWYEYAMILTINLLIYISTDSRNSFLLVLLVVVCDALIRSGLVDRIMQSRVVKLVIKWCFVLCAAASIAATVAYSGSSSIWREANSLLSNRLEQTQESLEKYGITPLGQKIAFQGNGLIMTEQGALEDEFVDSSADSNFIDSSYMNILIRLGIISLLLTITMMTSGCFAAVSEGDYSLQLCLVFTALHALLDPQLLELPYDLFLIAGYAALRKFVYRTATPKYRTDKISN